MAVSPACASALADAARTPQVMRACGCRRPHARTDGSLRGIRARCCGQASTAAPTCRGPPTIAAHLAFVLGRQGARGREGGGGTA